MKATRFLLSAGTAAALSLSVPAHAQKVPADHPPIPEGVSASPARLPPQPDPSGLPLPSGHPQVAPGSAPMSTDELIQRLDAAPDLESREKSFEMAAMIGRLYLHRGRYADARTYFTQAKQKGERLGTIYLAQKDALTAADRAKLAGATCPLQPDAGLEQHLTHVEAELAKGNRVEAAACTGVVLGSLVELYDQLGRAAQLDGDAPAAIEAHDGALRINPDAPESLFARSALQFETQGENPAALKAARDGFARYVEKHPEGPRAANARELQKRVEGAIAEGGVKAWVAARRTERLQRVAKELPVAARSATPPVQAASGTAAPADGELAVLTPEMIEAVQSTERTPELEAGLAKLVEEGEEHLAKERYQEALAAYRRVVPFQPENTRAQAGMAWAMVGLGRGAVAERIWGVAVNASPESVDALGDTLLAKGNREAARAVWVRLSRSDAAYAKRADLEKKLR